MSEKENMMDLLYFGYHGKEANDLQKEFTKGMAEAFPNAELKNADDDIKGVRREMHLPIAEEENYYVWIIGNGWINASLTFNLLINGPGDKSKINGYLKKTKEKYPEAFKKEGEE